MMRRFLLPAFLVLITLFLALKNYSPGTYLIGWDSLHPEFNLTEAFSRVFSGVWREEQGIGAIAGHAHMVEIPRLIFISFLSMFLSADVLRWLYIFICLALGPLGVFYFLSYVFRKEREEFAVYLASFLGALFYLLNLGTLQHFFVPFEMFPTQFAFLPWLFYYALKILREGKRKNLLTFSIISFIASGMAYAPALFYAYFAALLLFLFVYWVSSRFSWVIFKRAFLTALLVVLTNAFWILPNLYSIKNQSKVISEAKINKLFSPEAFLRNVDSGNIKDVLVQKSFLFDWRAFDFETNSFVDLMQVWKSYLADERVLWLGYGLSGIAFGGFLLSLIKRNKVGVGLFAVGLLSLFFLVNINYSTGSIYKYLYTNFDAFKEGFRMPFTKFSILFEFSLSFFFGYFFFKLRRLSFLVAPFIVGVLILFMLPAFRGSLTSDVVRTEFPAEYSQIFSWFKGKEGRIAKLPIYTHWGWEYHDWGYEGSGFLTYGLSNPLLDRDFDRWSAYNESFYAEASRALYAGENDVFEKVLEKYQVKYLLLDESVINAGGSHELLFIPQIKELIAASRNIIEAARFGALTVYETNFDSGDKFVSAPEFFGRFDADSTYSQSDTVFASYGNYVNDPEGTTFPFVNFDKRMGVKVRQEANDLVITSNQLHFSGTKNIVAPDGPGSVFVNDNREVQVNLLIDQKISASLAAPEQESVFQNCDLKKIGTVERRSLENAERTSGEQSRTSRGIRYTAASGGVACEFFDFTDISHSEGYVLHVKGENRQGRGLKIYLQNWLTNRMDLEELLPEGQFDEYFFVLPNLATSYEIPATAQGYSLNLETRSFGRIASENVIETIEFIPVPVGWLRQIRLVPSAAGQLDSQASRQLDNLTANTLKINKVQKTGTWLYRVETEGEGLLELGQGFEEGWIAFARPVIRNTKYQIQKLPHVRVNSWANGWEVSVNKQSLPLRGRQQAIGNSSKNPSAYSLVPNASVIYIVYWPQLLEYLGFGLLGLTPHLLGINVFSNLKTAWLNHRSRPKKSLSVN